MADLDIVEVVNRTDKPFVCKWDGVTYTVPPGPKPINMIKHIAYHVHAKSCFGVDIYENKRNYSVGIVGVNNCDMIKDPNEKAKIGKHLDVGRISSVSGKKFIEKKLDNPQEVDAGSAVESVSTQVGFSSHAEGVEP